MLTFLCFFLLNFCILYCSCLFFLAGEDYEPVNRNVSLRDLIENDFIIEVIDDNEYEGATDEKFLVITAIVSGSHNGRVSIQPSSIEISIQDIHLKPGIFKCVHFKVNYVHSLGS